MGFRERFAGVAGSAVRIGFQTTANAIHTAEDVAQKVEDSVLHKEWEFNASRKAIFVDETEMKAFERYVEDLANARGLVSGNIFELERLEDMNRNPIGIEIDKDLLGGNVREFLAYGKVHILKEEVSATVSVKDLPEGDRGFVIDIDGVNINTGLMKGPHDCKIKGQWRFSAEKNKKGIEQYAGTVSIDCVIKPKHRSLAIALMAFPPVFAAGYLHTKVDDIIDKFRQERTVKCPNK